MEKKATGGRFNLDEKNDGKKEGDTKAYKTTKLDKYDPSDAVGHALRIEGRGDTKFGVGRDADAYRHVQGSLVTLHISLASWNQVYQRESKVLS
jgi:hypothetical protein